MSGLRGLLLGGRRTRPSPRRRVILAGIVLMALAAAFTAVNATTADRIVTEQVTITGAQAPWDEAPVTLDATVYVPSRGAGPAVIVAHGFGGSKDTVDEQARDLADRGYVVVAYTARGFGDSTGSISLDSLDAEIPDARKVVDYLATRDDVLSDGEDPVVGVVGGSYGGAAALMLAGTDPRVDAVVASITWHDLNSALAPSGVVGSPGEVKRAWVSTLLGSVTGLPGPEPGCGRLQADLCAGYAEVMRSGVVTPQLRALLDRSSPAAVIDGVTAPTLLLQGESDTLFGLDQSVANAEALRKQGTLVALQWFPGGHDGGPADARTTDRGYEWLRYHLQGDGSAPSLDFRYAVTSSAAGGRARWLHSEHLPTPGASADTLPLTVADRSQSQTVTNPVGGLPAAVTSLPGLSSAVAAAGSAGSGTGEPAGAGLAALSPPPGQSATFVSPPLREARVVAGGPTARVTVTALTDSPAPIMFAAVGVHRDTRAASAPMDVAGRAVVPVRLAPLAAGESTEVEVALPWVVFRAGEGDRIAVRFVATDQAYAGSPDAASYQLSQVSVALPPPVGQPMTATNVPGQVLAALAVFVLVSGAGLWWAGRPGTGRARSHRAAPAPPTSEQAASSPLVVRGLRKNFGDLTVVRDVTFTVRPGRVVGLLGPNGAGKTTTLRMVLGLIRPSGGAIELFGQPAGQDQAGLTRVGALVEGAGFLPHLSGAANLTLYWRVTGRPLAEARLAEVLEIADLGAAVHRRVGTYSQGMRQRLAVAQAMLGMPDLLILDEPTNGLDPPQIHAMRAVLRAYAADHRCVLVSSHLLAEVEQTCDDVVVIHRGRTVAAGRVAELTSSSGEMVFGVDDPARAGTALDGLVGVSGLQLQGGTVSARVDDPAGAVAELVRAGVRVSSATARHRLEDVFLQLVDDGTDVAEG